MPFLCLTETRTDRATERPTAHEEKEQGLPLHYRDQKPRVGTRDTSRSRLQEQSLPKGKKSHLPVYREEEGTLDWELREMSFQVPFTST